MNELHRQGRELLDAARRERTPDAAARERVFAALMEGAALRGDADAGGSVETKLLTGFAKWLVLAGLAAALAGALYWAGHVGGGAAP